jgi:HKD family nuclease
VCAASTFTFDATFFETECIGRFLQMDTHPSESESVGYLVEREEKLSAASISVLVDRRHAVEKESLRWDVMGVAVPQASQHAKVSLLAWTNHVRVVIGSGNLTEPGYRSNLEVFGSLDLKKSGGAKTEVMATLAFLRDLANYAVGTDGAKTAKGRTVAALDRVKALIAGWRKAETEKRSPKVVFGRPGASVLKQVVAQWPDRQPPTDVFVLSPFFDAPGPGQAIAKEVAAILSRRGTTVTVFVRVAYLPDGKVRVHAPLEMVRRLQETADVSIVSVAMEQDGDPRELHAKMLALGNKKWCALLIGSSNFTSLGLGASATRANFEANLLYSAKTSDRSYRALDRIWPESGEEIDVESKLNIWNTKEEAEEGEGAPCLPIAFQDAVYMPGQAPALEITLASGLPVVWSIQLRDGVEVLSSRDGIVQGRHRCALSGSEPPLLLNVSWTENDKSFSSAWPVNVADPGALPPPAELRSLSLDELIAVLSSTRPMHQAVIDVLRRRGRSKKNSDEHLDPLRRFDSPTLLRRSKRFAAALEQLKKRLERPAASPDALAWRLNGPVGPLQLATALQREAKLNGEARFCLAELALVVASINPGAIAVGGVPQSHVVTSLNGLVAELQREASLVEATTNENVSRLDTYVTAVFQKVRRP